MIGPIVQFFEKLADDFTWGRFSLLISAILFVAASLWIYESYTGSLKLGKLEKQIVLLEKLSMLNNDESIRDNKILLATFDALSNELKAVNSPTFKLLNLSRRMKQALSASIPWLFFSLIILLFIKGKSSSALLGICLVSAPLIIIGYWLPLLNESWVNYIVYPAISFLLAVLLVKVWQNKKS